MRKVSIFLLVAGRVFVLQSPGCADGLSSVGQCSVSPVFPRDSSTPIAQQLAAGTAGCSFASANQLGPLLKDPAITC